MTVSEPKWWKLLLDPSESVFCRRLWVAGLVVTGLLALDGQPGPFAAVLVFPFLWGIVGVMVLIVGWFSRLFLQALWVFRWISVPYIFALVILCQVMLHKSWYETGEFVVVGVALVFMLVNFYCCIAWALRYRGGSGWWDDGGPVDLH